MNRPIGDPPNFFGSEQAAVWNEIVGEAPDGLLERSDRLAVELTVYLMLRCRSTDARRGDYTQLECMLSKCGLVPRSRKRIMAQVQKTSQQNRRPN